MEEANSSPLRHRTLPALDPPSNNRSRPESPSRGLFRGKGQQRRVTSASASSGIFQWGTVLVILAGLFIFQARILRLISQSTMGATTSTRGEEIQPLSLTSWTLRSDPAGNTPQARHQLVGRGAARNHGTTAKAYKSNREPTKRSVAATPKSDRPKPTIYLDVGPYKTGTSFLQCALARNGYRLLKQDNVLYLGTCASECAVSAEQYEFCLMHSVAAVFHNGDSNTVEVDAGLKAKLTELARSGRDALMVWEYFSDRDMQLIKRFVAFLERGFHVRVILHYRRLYEWLPSIYDQLHRPKWNGHEQYMIWPGDVWIRQSGKRVVGRARAPFDMYSIADQSALGLDPGFRGTISNIRRTGLHPFHRARKLWDRFVPNITVVEMHHLPPRTELSRGDPLLTHLFCHVIPSLNRTCEAARRDEIVVLEQGRNARFSVENYDLLAVHAHRLGLHPHGISQLTRSDAVLMIQYQQERVYNKTVRDFPLTCLSNHSLEMLFNLSLTAEQSFLPEVQDDHRHHFEQAVRAGKFCTIDVNRTLELREWRNVLRPFVSVAPHVLERGADGRWTPDFEATTKSLHDILFTYQLGRPLEPSLPRLEFLGFLSVPGIGLSTLLESWQTGGCGRQYTNYLNQESYREHGKETSMAISTWTCIVGSLPESESGCNVSRQSSAAAPPPRCKPSMTYASLVEGWLDSLPYLSASGVLVPPHPALLIATPAPEPRDDSIGKGDDDEEVEGEGGDDETDEDDGEGSAQYDATAGDGMEDGPSLSANGAREMLQVSLTVVMMVRDPVDRLASLYPQWRATYNGTEAPRDMEGWLEWLGQGGGAGERRGAGLVRDQFRSVSDDFAQAASQVGGSRTNGNGTTAATTVLVLLHECWEESVRLLGERHPGVVSPDMVRDGLAALEGDPAGESMPHLLPLPRGGLDWMALRAKARLWLPDEYAFYDAAVAQCRRLLDASAPSSQIVGSACHARLLPPAAADREDSGGPLYRRLLPAGSADLARG